jgi:formate dehydrogenase iron-sulfur subunit
MAAARTAADPDRYVKHIYGLEEVAGTAVIFISPVPFEEIGFNVGMGTYPLPELTWRALQHVPATVLAGGGLLAGSYWIFKRRAEVRNSRAADMAVRKDRTDE